MSEIAIMTDGGRSRHWPAVEQLRIVAETMLEGERISAAARRNGEAPNLLNRVCEPRACRLLTIGACIAFWSATPFVWNDPELIAPNAITTARSS